MKAKKLPVKKNDKVTMRRFFEIDSEYASEQVAQMLITKMTIENKNTPN